MGAQASRMLPNSCPVKQTAHDVCIKHARKTNPPPKKKRKDRANASFAALACQKRSRVWRPPLAYQKWVSCGLPSTRSSEVRRRVPTFFPWSTLEKEPSPTKKGVRKGNWIGDLVIWWGGWWLPSGPHTAPPHPHTPNTPSVAQWPWEKKGLLLWLLDFPNPSPPPKKKKEGETGATGRLGFEWLVACGLLPSISPRTPAVGETAVSPC